MKFRFIALILSVGLLSMGLAGCGSSVSGSGPSSAAVDSSTPSSETTPAVSSEAVSSEEVSEAASEEERSSAPADSGSLGDFDVAILSARKAVDYEGKPALVVSYKFTNNAADNKMFLSSVSGKAFQDGVQLDTAVITGDDSISVENQMKEVKTGASIEVDVAYLLDSEASDVEVEVSELISFSDEKIVKVFKLADLS